MSGEPRGVGTRAVSLRPAAATDCERVWRWRNDPETREASFGSAPIPWDVHERWFSDALHRGDRKLFMIVADAMAVGTARLDIAGREAEASIHLAPEWRGRGIGSIYRAMDNPASTVSTWPVM